MDEKKGPPLSGVYNAEEREALKDLLMEQRRATALMLLALEYDDTSKMIEGTLIAARASLTLKHLHEKIEQRHTVAMENACRQRARDSWMN